MHDKSATNPRRRCFRSEDRDGGRFRTDAKAEEESGDEHVPPSICECLPEAGQSREEASEEDCTSSTEEAVEGNGEPAPKKGATQIGSRIEKTSQPCRSRVVAADAVLVFVEELTPVPAFSVSSSFLVPEFSWLCTDTTVSSDNAGQSGVGVSWDGQRTHALHGSTRRTDDNDDVQQRRLMPAMVLFGVENQLLCLGQAGNGLVFGRILGQHGTLGESADVFLIANLVFPCIACTHLLQHGMTDAGQRIGQFGIHVPPGTLGSGGGTNAQCGGWYRMVFIVVFWIWAKSPEGKGVVDVVIVPVIFQPSFGRGLGRGIWYRGTNVRRGHYRQRLEGDSKWSSSA